MKWDVFISHAFEDKNFARELADSLSKIGLKVWYDEFELHVGDSLSKSINNGLSESAYGIVVLSQNFFRKEWTQKELGALTSRETLDRKVILPIWLNIDKDEIIKYSPILADKFAINSIFGIEKIVGLLYSEIKGEALKITNHEKRKRSVFEVDLEQTKKLLRNKQIEMEAVLVQAGEVAHIDYLTRLHNRRTINIDIQNEMMRANHYRTPFSIIKINLDNYEMFVEHKGRFIADSILSGLAFELRELTKAPNSIARYFGSNFLCLMPGMKSIEAGKHAETICKLFTTTPIAVEKNLFNITLSLGVAEYKINEESFGTLLERVDKLMLIAIANGGNQCVVEQEGLGRYSENEKD